MEFSLSQEHRQLAAVAQEWLRKNAHRDARPSWPDLVGLGWLDRDLDCLALVVLAEEMGYATFALPWFATAGLAAMAYAAAGRDLPAEPCTLAGLTIDGKRSRSTVPPQYANLPECRAVPEPGGWRLHGGHHRVPDLPAARTAVVVALVPDGIGLFEVDLRDEAAGVLPLSTVDETRPLADLALTGCPARLLVGPAEAEGLLCRTRDRANLLVAAEAVGIARYALERATEHATTRTQFGRPIGVHQAVAHPLVDAYARLQVARALTYRAAWAQQTRTPDAPQATLCATVAAREAAILGCEDAIQTLGAGGFLWDGPIGAAYRRAQWINGFDGLPSDHRVALAKMVLD